MQNHWPFVTGRRLLVGCEQDVLFAARGKYEGSLDDAVRPVPQYVSCLVANRARAPPVDAEWRGREELGETRYE